MPFLSSPNLVPVESAGNTPPVSPVTDGLYIILGSPTGTWSSNANSIARWTGSAYEYFTPYNRTLLWTRSSPITFYSYDSAVPGWEIPTATGSAGSGANTALSNLASVSISSSLFFQSAKDIGSTTVPPRNIYLYGGGTFGSHSFQLTGTPTGNRALTLPDATTNLVGHDISQTLTNKTINASNNTLSNITETMLSFSDITTLNATTSQHGFLRKLNGTATTYLDGSGNWSTPSGTGASLPAPDNTDLVANNSDPTKLLRFDLSGLSGSTTANLTIPNTASGTLVLTTFAQTLTNKTLTTPTIASFANATHDHSNAAGGGNLTPTAFGLTDPNADRLVFWDDSVGAWAYLSLGTNLSITGTTLDAAGGGGGGTPGGSGTELQFRGGSSTFSAVSGSSVTADGNITLAPTAVTSGTPVLLTITGGTHTGMTASEFSDLNFNLNRIVTFTGSTGFATQRVMRFQMPTLAFTSATGTITDAVGLEIDSPKQGTNATLTRSTALRVKPSATAHHGIWVDSQVSAGGDGFALGVAGTKVMRFTHVSGNTNFVFGEGVSISDSSTNGFVYVPNYSSSTSPTGTPTTYNNTTPIYTQRNAVEGFNRLWVNFNGTWQNMTPFHAGGTGNPTIAANTGAGTGPTISISGKNGCHEVTLTPGSSPAASNTVFTVTFNNTSGSFVVTPYPVITPSDSDAAALTGTAQVYVSSRSTTTYVVSVGSTPLVQSVQYKWIIHCFS